MSKNNQHQRIEVIARPARRRRWTTEQKLRILEEALQHGALELEERIVGLAASAALALRRLLARQRPDLGAVHLPRHGRLDRFQLIALGA
jgi:hypothetical protein